MWRCLFYNIRHCSGFHSIRIGTVLVVIHSARVGNLTVIHSVTLSNVAVILSVTSVAVISGSGV